MCAYSKEYEESRRLLVRAIASLKAKEFKSAKRMLESILRLPSTYEQISEAHYWLSEISENDEEKREHLDLALSHNPANHLARKKLAILDGRLDESKIIDPDNIPSQDTVKPIQSLGERFICKNCGGNLTYSPDGSQLICEYCQSQQQFSNSGKVNELDFVVGISTIAGQKKAETTQSFTCKACGAVYLISPEALSLTCPHCDSSYSIQQAEVSELIPPEGIIPFTVSKDKVGKIIIQWLMDNQVKKTPHIENFTGIYLPAWSFDICGLIKWTGQLSENEPYFPSSDQRYFSFNDVLIPACIRRPAMFMEVLTGFNPDDIIAFSPKYTANWLAESYTIPMSDAAIEAHSQAFKSAKQTLRDKDEIDNLINVNFSSADLFIEAFKLILVPVWIAVYIFSGTGYHVTINGRSGEILGELPPTRLQRLTKWLTSKEKK
jgi:Zn finger protein HypA/HybF involved in hydrogenase expression